MLSPQSTFETLSELGVTFFTGVPDSALKDFCAYVTDHTDERSHVIAANEGAAIGLAAGYHLATGNVGLVYMQNSGQGNAVNPLVSLADPEVYGIPMLLLIGWRGEPGHRDEPQHVKQGRLTLTLMETLGIPHRVLPVGMNEAREALQQAVDAATHDSSPYALIARTGTFEPYRLERHSPNPYPLTREEAIRMLANRLDPTVVVVSTTGRTSRELFEHRLVQGEDPGRDFLTVGSMGHASSIALGIALAKPGREIYCLDGDGAVIMHMGSLATIGARRLVNFKHVLLNNGAHDSVGAQPTVGFEIDFPSIARACGYRLTLRAESAEELEAAIGRLQTSPGPSLLEIRVGRGARSDLGRPTSTPLQNKLVFMRRLSS